MARIAWHFQCFQHHGCTAPHLVFPTPPDQRRTVPLAQFEPLARVPGVKLISLQKGSKPSNSIDSRVGSPSSN